MLTRTPRRLVVMLAGLVAALAVAATPAVASADSGRWIPVRLSPAGGQEKNPDTYLETVDDSFAVVLRTPGGISLSIRDWSVQQNDPVVVAIFNTPSHCVPVSYPGKHVLDPDGDQVSLCDPGLAADRQAGGFAVVSRTDMTVGYGRYISVTVPAGRSLTNPMGAEIAVVLPKSRHIVISSPYIPGEGDDE